MRIWSRKFKGVAYLELNFDLISLVLIYIREVNKQQALSQRDSVRGGGQVFQASSGGMH